MGGAWRREGGDGVVGGGGAEEKKKKGKGEGNHLKEGLLTQAPNHYSSLPSTSPCDSEREGNLRAFVYDNICLARWDLIFSELVASEWKSNHTLLCCKLRGSTQQAQKKVGLHGLMSQHRHGNVCSCIIVRLLLDTKENLRGRLQWLIHKRRLAQV